MRASTPCPRVFGRSQVDKVITIRPGQTVTCGRYDCQDVQFPGHLTIGRRHLMVWQEADPPWNAWIIDRGSRNGTLMWRSGRGDWLELIPGNRYMIAADTFVKIGGHNHGALLRFASEACVRRGGG